SSSRSSERPQRHPRADRTLLPRAPVRTLPSMSEPLISLDTSLIHDGRLDELKEAVTELVEFVRSNEPRPIAYEIYFDEAGSRMTVVQVHPDSASMGYHMTVGGRAGGRSVQVPPDSASMEYHMTVAGPAFAGFAELITLSTLDVYGKPSEELLELLRRKVQLLGDATVVVHDLQAGFARI